MQFLKSLNLDASRARRSALALAIAVAGSAGLAAFAQPAPGDAPPEGPPHGGWHHMHRAGPGPDGLMDGRMLQHMLDEVDATTEQRGQIKSILAAARTDLKAQHTANAGLRQRAMDVFTQPTVDANAAEALRQQMLAQHDQASKRMMQAMLDVSRVLTPDQRAKLAEKMKAREARMQQRMQSRSGASAPSK